MCWSTVIIGARVPNLALVRGLVVFRAIDSSGRAVVRRQFILRKTLAAYNDAGLSTSLSPASFLWGFDSSLRTLNPIETNVLSSKPHWAAKPQEFYIRVNPTCESSDNPNFPTPRSIDSSEIRIVPAHRQFQWALSPNTKRSSQRIDSSSEP